jgi:cytochrome c-type biogenesis protein
MQGDFAYSFILGVLAAVNPCGFVLLPTYLMYFLGLETNRESTQTASLRRALTVSAAVSGGFIAIFLVVGIVTRLFTTVISDNAKYVGLIVGVVLTIMGVAMLAGWKPTFMRPSIPTERDSTMRAMFVYGIAYAVASIGCTIGLLTTVVLGSVGRHGFVSGVSSIVLYGLGMALFVTALTVTLATAQRGLLTFARNSLCYIDKVSAVFIALAGLYLTWYWYGAVTERSSDSVTGTVEDWQSSVTSFLQDQGAWRLAIVFAVIVGTAVVRVRVATSSTNHDRVRT